MIVILLSSKMYSSLVDQHFDLKQPGKVDGGANRSDTAHRGVAGGEDRTQKRSIKVIRYTKL